MEVYCKKEIVPKQFIIECPSCKSKFVADEDDLEKQQHGDRYNVGEKCEICGWDNGFDLIGGVKEVKVKKEELEESLNRNVKEFSLEITKGIDVDKQTGYSADLEWNKFFTRISSMYLKTVGTEQYYCSRSPYKMTIDLSVVDTEFRTSTLFIYISEKLYDLLLKYDEGKLLKDFETFYGGYVKSFYLNLDKSLSFEDSIYKVLDPIINIWKKFKEVCDSLLGEIEVEWSN